MPTDFPGSSSATSLSFILLFLALLSALSVSPQEVPLHLPLYRRSTSADPARFVHTRLKLIAKYCGQSSSVQLRKRQISVPIIGTLPSSNSTLPNRGRPLNTTGGFNQSTTLRGLNDGRGGVVGLTRTFNFQADLEYFTSIQIGNPPQLLNVILDTGSADFWVASSNCTSSSGCSTSLGPKYDPINSSTTNAPFSIKYGSGSAIGKIYTDNMTFAGYNISNQDFGTTRHHPVVSRSLKLISEWFNLAPKFSGRGYGFLRAVEQRRIRIDGCVIQSTKTSKPIFTGLGFQPLAASGILPIWQSLLQNASQYNLSFPGFSFALTRYINATGSIKEVEPGGLFTLGTLNASLFDGEIEFIPLPKGLESYWLIPMGGLTVGGVPVDLGSETTKNVAIDSGTTLLGGPAEQVKAFYSHVPGSVAASGSYQGYYSYPCNITVDVSLQFGTRNYSMAPQDFNLGPFGTNGMCLGAVFELTLAGASKQLISWVIGDSFLKNVVSVYRYLPPAVGFAKLSIPPFNTTGPASIAINGTLFNPSTLKASEFNIATSKATAALPSEFAPQISNLGPDGKNSGASVKRNRSVEGLAALVVLVVVAVVDVGFNGLF